MNFNAKKAYSDFRKLAYDFHINSSKLNSAEQIINNKNGKPEKHI